MKRRRWTKLCPSSGKRTYPTSLDCLLDHMHNPRKIRAYECEQCGGYHATSKPPRERRAA